MKTSLTTSLYIAVIFIISSCTNGESSSSPKCSDELIVSTLKEIVSENRNIDTANIIVKNITTTTQDEKYHSCECSGIVVVTDPDAVVDTTSSESQEFKYELPVKYKGQETDDRKSTNVQVLEGL